MGLPLQSRGFTYALTRRYPYRWFPWVTIAGGVCALVLFSAINLAAVGYELEVRYTTNPNETLNRQLWTQKAPFSWFDKTAATCQPQNLPIRSQVFTNKFGLVYSLEGIWQNNSDGAVTVLPSLNYVNNPVKDCGVSSMRFNVAHMERTVEQYQMYPWGIDATAYITCAIDNAPNHTFVNLTTNYDFFWESNKWQYLLELNQTSQASLWWGQSLLGWHYVQMASAFVNNANALWGNGDGTQHLSRATYEVTPKRFDSAPSNMTSIRYFGKEFDDAKKHLGGFSGEGFRFQCRQAVDGYITDYDLDPSFCGGIDNSFPDSDTSPYSFIWQPAHDYAVTFYSVILADLGNNATKNLLTSPDYLQYYSTNFTSANQTMQAILTSYNLDTTNANRMPSDRTYGELKDTTGPLEITPSTIYAQYFCQVPKQKSAGSLFVGVFIADLVFLQACWTLLKFLTTLWLERTDADAMYCRGCLALQKQVEAYEMRSMEFVGGAGTPRMQPSPGLKPLVVERRPHLYHNSSDQLPLISMGPLDVDAAGIGDNRR